MPIVVIFMVNAPVLFSVGRNYTMAQMMPLRVGVFIPLLTINHQVNVIEHEWPAICDEASLSEVDRALFWRRQFLNPFAFLNAPQEVRIPLTG
jgi:hypothetical protein